MMKDIFELTTRASRNEVLSARSRGNSNVPTPSLSRDISVDRDLANFQSGNDANLISQTQKLKDYFKKLERNENEEDDDDDEFEDEDPWELEDDDEECDEDPNDMSSENNRAFTIQHFPEQSPLISNLQKQYHLPFLACQQYQETLKRSIIEYALPIIIAHLSNVTIVTPSSGQNIQLVPFWNFYQQISSATLDRSNIDFSYLLLLYLNQCMERSQKASVLEMIDQFHGISMQLIDTEQHPLVAKILPELMSSADHQSVANTVDGAAKDHHATSKESDKVKFLWKLIFQHLEENYSVTADLFLTKEKVLAEKKVLSTPHIVLYTILLFQDETKRDRIHEIFQLLMNYSLTVLNLLPSEVKEWNFDMLSSPSNNPTVKEDKDAEGRKKIERTMLFLMDVTSQLQIILSLLVVKANELLELQRIASNNLYPAPASSTTAIQSQTSHNFSSPHHKLQQAEEGVIILDADNLAKVKDQLQEVFWNSVQAIVMQYRILLPYLSYVIRTSTLFLTVHTRPDIVYILLAENMNVDWYTYLHNLTNLVTAGVPTEELSEPLDSNDGNLRSQRSRSSTTNSETYISSGISLSAKRKHSRAEQWMEMIQPEANDEGYQYVAIVTREQCHEILQDKTIGSFILRPQESFSECNQFILSFRTSGIETVKHAVIRRENNPSAYDLSVVPNEHRRGYLYRCGKLGPVDSLDGILHAISDIIAHPLVFQPVIPSFLSYLPGSSSALAVLEGFDSPISNDRKQNNDGSERPSNTFLKVLDFPSFDINYQFWKIIQEILPKLVNTIDLYHLEKIMNQSNFIGGSSDDPHHGMMSMSDEDERDADEIDHDVNEGPRDEDDEYVIDDFGEPKPRTKRPSYMNKRLFKDLFTKAIKKSPLSNYGQQDNDKTDKWKLSVLGDDFVKLFDRILVVLTIKQYYQQLLSSSFANLLDSIWKFEIESIPDEIVANDSQAATHHSHGLTDHHRKAQLLQLFKEKIVSLFHPYSDEGNESLYSLYYNYYIRETRFSTLPVDFTTPQSRKKEENTVSRGSHVIFAKGLFSKVLKFWVLSEREIHHLIIPSPDNLRACAFSKITNEVSGSKGNKNNEEQLLETVLETNLSYSSYDKICLQYLDDIVDRLTTSASSSGTSSGAISSTKELHLMEKLLRQLYGSCTVKTVRFPGHRNGYGMNEFLLPDCIEVNEMMNVLGKWLGQLEEVLALVKVKLPSEPLAEGGKENEEDSSEDEDEEENEDGDDLMNEIFISKKTSSDYNKSQRKPQPPVKPRAQIQFSSMDYDDDDDDDDDFAEHHLKSVPSPPPPPPPSIIPPPPTVPETIDLRTPVKAKSSEAIGEEQGEKEGAEITEKLEGKENDTPLIVQKERLFPLPESDDENESISPLQKIFQKLNKRWKKIVNHPSFTSIVSAGSSNTSGNKVIVLDLVTTKLLIEIIDFLQLTNRTMKKEIAQKMINWFFMNKSLIQITKPNHELSLYSSLASLSSASSSLTYYHYVDAWEVKVLTDISLAKEHVRLGRQSYTGIPSSSSVSLASSSGVIPSKGLATSSNRAGEGMMPSSRSLSSMIISGDSELNKLSDHILKHNFNASYTLTLASLLKMQRFLKQQERYCNYRNARGSGDMTPSVRYDGLNESMKEEREEYYEYSYCKLWEYIRGEQYLMEVISQATTQTTSSVTDQYAFYPPPINSMTYLPTVSTSSLSNLNSSASVANSGHGSTSSFPFKGGIGAATHSRGSAALTSVPRSLSLHGYAMHPANHHRYWNGCVEGTSAYLSTLQDYLYKNSLFQRLHLYYRFIAYLQVDFYGIKEILSLQPPPRSANSPPPGNEVLNLQQHQSTVNALNHLSKNMAATHSQNSLMHFFSGAAIANPVVGATTITAVPARSTPAPAKESSVHSTATATSNASSAVVIGAGGVGHGPTLVGSGSHTHSSGIVTLTPTTAPHSQSLEVYCVIRLVKDHYPRNDTPNNTSAGSSAHHPSSAVSGGGIFGSGFMSAASASASHHTPHKSGYYDESYVSLPRKIDLLPKGIFPSTAAAASTSSSSLTTNALLGQILSSHDYEWRHQSIFRFPLPESWLLLIEDHINVHFAYTMLKKQREEEEAIEGKKNHKKKDGKSQKKVEEEDILLQNMIETMPPMKLVIFIYEKTFFGDNKLGELEINLFDLNDQNVLRDWFPLTNSSSSEKVSSSSASYLLYLQTKLRFHLMQMDGNYTTATANTSTATAAAAALANKVSSTAANSASTTAKIVGRGQPHPGHLLATMMKKKAGTDDDEGSRQSGSGASSPVIKISGTAKNTVNLYEDEEEMNDSEVKDTVGPLSTPVKQDGGKGMANASPSTSTTTSTNISNRLPVSSSTSTSTSTSTPTAAAKPPAGKGTEDKPSKKFQDLLKSGNKFLSHLDDFF